MTKRLFDIVLAASALAVAGPLFVFAALIVKATSTGPVFFRQTRVGLGGRNFRILKFRTMHHGQAPGAPEITVGGDPRVTTTGRWLRHWKIDELPQLLNVLAGQMSIVGPRPEVPRYADLWPADLRPAILSVRPGLTDPATLQFLDEEKLLASAADPESFYVKTILPAKAAAYADYARNRSLAKDGALIISTIFALVFNRRRLRGKVRGT